MNRKGNDRDNQPVNDKLCCQTLSVFSISGLFDLFIFKFKELSVAKVITRNMRCFH